MSKYQSFKACDLEIELSKSSNLNVYKEPYGFGTYFTDHMFEVYWTEKDGWSTPRIVPFHNLNVHPASNFLQYSFQAFEGMKSFRGHDGKIRLFRPLKHFQRLKRSAAKLFLPDFDPQELVECTKKLLQVDKDWNLPPEMNTSLYLRPTIIGNDDCLGFDVCKKAMLYVIASISGSYFKPGNDEFKLFIENSFRPNGMYKLGSNYGPTISSLILARENNCQQTLMVDGENDLISEAATMNFFAFIKNKNGGRELVTPSLKSGHLLPGITRDSVLELAKELNEFVVSERDLSLGELEESSREGRLLEMFCTGTAVTIRKVNKIVGRKEITAMTSDSELLSTLLHNKLKAIMNGVEQFSDFVLEI